MKNPVNIEIREIESSDLEDYLYWNNPSRKFHEYNGPYYRKRTEKELIEYVDGLKTRLLGGETNVLNNSKVVVDKETGKLIGSVNWYWKSEETLWMEIGIVIFNENYWSMGLGYDILNLWVDEIFSSRPELVRLGLSTWSGNLGMMRLAEKLGFVKEAVYRKARIVDGEYYDSISYGILRSEWEKLKNI